MDEIVDGPSDSNDSEEFEKAIGDGRDRPVDKISNLLLKLFILTVLGHFVLNLIGSPLVTGTYILSAIVMFSIVLVCDFEKSVMSLLIFALIEGQGRVLLGYNPIFRVYFDLLLIFMIFKNAIRFKKILNREKIPGIIFILIVFHAFWWMLELFNPLGPGIFASFATSKFYIFPFFLFFGFTLLAFEYDKNKETARFFNILMLFMALECIVCIVQMSNGEEFMNGMSQNYTSLFKSYENFTGVTFRPWGTTHLPGGGSTFIYLSIGFFMMNLVLIRRNEDTRFKWVHHLLVALYILLSWFVLFINQVRSAFLKEFLIIILMLMAQLIGARYRMRKMVGIAFSVALLAGFVMQNMENFESQLGESLNLSNAIKRYSALAEKGGVSSARSDFSSMLDNLIYKSELPFGYGLGMTTNLLPAFGAQRAARYDIDPVSFWNFDNLFVFLFLELGIGSIFYILIIVLNPILLLIMAFAAFKRQNEYVFLVVSSSFSTIIVLTIFNWGAVAIPFNPESFFYWFWMALAYVTFFKAYPKGQKEKKI